MGEILRDPPVFHVLVQMVFTPIPTMKENIDKIHEEFRSQGFVDRKQEFHQGVYVNPNDASQNLKFEQVNKITWHFSNFESDSGFMLSDEFLIFHTTNYQNFEEFLSKFSDGVRALTNAVGVFYVTRFGLRYLNAVLIPEGEYPANYLIRDVVGVGNVPLKDHGFLAQHTMFESVLLCPQNNKTCTSRVVMTRIESSPPIMPQDLIPLIQKLKTKDKFHKMTGLIALLDTDCAKVDLREKPEIEKIQSHIIDLHSDAAIVFKSLITTERFELWKI